MKRMIQRTLSPRTVLLLGAMFGDRTLFEQPKYESKPSPEERQRRLDAAQAKRERRIARNLRRLGRLQA